MFFLLFFQELILNFPKLSHIMFFVQYKGLNLLAVSTFRAFVSFHFQKLDRLLMYNEAVLNVFLELQNYIVADGGHCPFIFPHSLHYTCVNMTIVVNAKQISIKTLPLFRFCKHHWYYKPFSVIFRISNISLFIERRYHMLIEHYIQIQLRFF